MLKNRALSDILNFYQENDLDEVYDNTSNNKLKKPLNKINFSNNEVASSPIKIIASTSQALNKLANRAQAVNQGSDPMIIQATKSESDNKFLSLDQIVLEAKSLAKKANSIDELKKIVENFEGCNLKKMATNTVFSSGNCHSKIMVIGEAPGNHEDLQGIPFCGDSGELLNAMFKAINLSRENDFYVTNVIFWRPPGNRRPTEEELTICKPFLERHIELFNPKLLILVGATAMNAFLKNGEAISKVRGQFLDFSPKFLANKCKIFTIFHPSFLMRQPTKKKVAWQDMLKLKDFINNDYA